MNWTIVGSLVACLAAAASPVPGVVCAPIEGQRILGSDLAGAHAAFASVPAGAVVAAAPVPGARRVLAPAELRRLANRLLAPGERPLHWDAPLCFEYAAAPLSEARIAAVLARAFPPPAEVEIASFTQFPVPPGEIEFPDLSRRSLRPDRADGTSLLRGWVRYQERRRHPFWVRIRVSSAKMKPVAGEALVPGQPVAATQIRMTPAQGWLLADPPAMAELVGREPRRAIPAGTALSPAMFLPPREVRKGEIIRVTAAIGQARVEMETRAESQARLGERIVLKNLQSGQRFVARVDGPGRATAEAALPARLAVTPPALARRIVE